MVHVVHASRKQSSTNLERCEDSFERRSVQQYVGRLGHIGGMHRIVKWIVLDVVVF